jgi:hypothetical protein
MPRAHLTDIVVSRLKTVGIYYDTTTPAFGIRIGKNRKAWVITRGTDRQRITIGLYPSMGLADARKEAKKLQQSRGLSHGSAHWRRAKARLPPPSPSSGEVF